MKTNVQAATAVSFQCKESFCAKSYLLHKIIYSAGQVAEPVPTWCVPHTPAHEVGVGHARGLHMTLEETSGVQTPALIGQVEK